jgi:hypothetical protein
MAIETALALRLLFHLPLRQTEGFLRSILLKCETMVLPLQNVVRWRAFYRILGPME